MENNMNIEELSEQTNQRLSAYDFQSKDNRQNSFMNPRLIRHYHSIGLLSTPKKNGKQSNYEEYHIWELIFIKKLLSEKFGLEAIKKLFQELKLESDYLKSLKTAIEKEQFEYQNDTENDALSFLNQLSGQILSNSQANTPSSFSSQSTPTYSTFSNLMKSKSQIEKKNMSRIFSSSLFKIKCLSNNNTTKIIPG
jgi:DNA-binding transcriptional MerR regulator